MAVPLSKTPLFSTGAHTGTVVQPPISSAHYGRLSLSHSSCKGKARLVPSLTSPIFAGTLRPLPSRAPGPPGQTLSPSLSGAPVRSLRFVGHTTSPLSLPPGFPSHPLSYGTSVRRGRSGRYSNLIRGLLFRKKGSSFARDPLTHARASLLPPTVFVTILIDDRSSFTGRFRSTGFIQNVFEPNCCYHDDLCSHSG